MPRVHHVKKARKDNPAVKAGEPYYWWKFAFGAKNFSKTPPKNSQLTQSEYLGALYDIQDSLDDRFDSYDGVEDAMQQLIEEVEQLRDEQEEKRSNMPEHLQDVGSGELLQERYDAMDGVISELDSINLEKDEGHDEEQFMMDLKDEVQGVAWS